MMAAFLPETAGALQPGLSGDGAAQTDVRLQQLLAFVESLPDCILQGVVEEE